MKARELITPELKQMEQLPSTAFLAMSLGFAFGTALIAAFQVSPMLMVVLITGSIAAYIEYLIRVRI